MLSAVANICTAPLSVILALIWLLLGVMCQVCWPRNAFVRFLHSRRLSIGLLSVALVMVAVEGTWCLRLYQSWPFVILMLLLSLQLSLAAMDDAKAKRWDALCSHAGFYLVIMAMLFGAPDRQDHQQVFSTNDSTHQLVNFSIDYYEDGVSPKQYTSTVCLYGDTLVTSVNHPARYHGWRIFQSDYDHRAGQFTLLTFVRDPWLPLVYIGILFMVCGAFAQLRMAWHSPKVIPVVGVLALLFGVLSITRIHFGTLMPALRSLWFVPHLIIYMVAYALMAVALVMSIWGCFSHRFADTLPRQLFLTASALLLLGMSCGAIWAKTAWGHYWTWDAKECWALVTWMLTLVAAHLPKPNKSIQILIFALSFAAMQMTWYGVNYLPASQYSMHTYNQPQ